MFLSPWIAATAVQTTDFNRSGEGGYTWIDEEALLGAYVIGLDAITPNEAIRASAMVVSNAR